MHGKLNTMMNSTFIPVYKGVFNETVIKTHHPKNQQLNSFRETFIKTKRF